MLWYCSHMTIYESEKETMPRLIIKEIATQQGFNQSKLQMRANVTPALLSRYWNNKTDSVTLDELGKIARVLGVAPGALIVEDSESGTELGLPLEEKESEDHS